MLNACLVKFEHGFFKCKNQIHINIWPIVYLVYLRVLRFENRKKKITKKIKRENKKQTKTKKYLAASVRL